MVKLDKNLIEVYTQEAYREAAEARAERRGAANGVIGILLVMVVTPVVFWLVRLF